MTEDLPNYAALEPPEDKPIEEYTHHERRAALLHRIREAGSPYAITQACEAERFDVHRSTISRDMTRLKQAIDTHLGADAKLTTRVLFETITEELLDEDDWKATKAAWDIVMDWNDWLADVGAQHREPKQSSVDLEMQSRNLDVAYQIVRDGDDQSLPTTATGDVDYEDLGFTSAPSSIEIDSSGGENDE